MKKYLFIVAAAAALLSSCAKEADSWTPGPEDSADKSLVWFQTGKASVEISPDSNQNISIVLERAETEGELSVPIIVEYNQSNSFSVSDIAYFADGEAETAIVVDATNVPVGESKSLTIKVHEDFYYFYKPLENGSIAYALSVDKKSWKTMFIGTYVSCLGYTLENVELQVCEQDETAWRFANLFADGYHVQFSYYSAAMEDSDGGTYYQIKVGLQEIGIDYKSYGVISMMDVATWQGSSGYYKYNYFYPDDGYVVIWAYYRVSAGYLTYNDDYFYVPSASDDE